MWMLATGRLLLQSALAVAPGLAWAVTPPVQCPAGDIACQGAVGGLVLPPGADTRPTGFIWLGDKQADGTVVSSSIGTPGTPTVLTPEQAADQLVSGFVLQIRNPVYIRQGLPPNTLEYFHAQPPVVLLRPGEHVVLLESPVSINRPSGQIQLWARVRLLPESLSNH